MPETSDAVLDLTVSEEAMAKLMEAFAAQNRDDLALRIYVKSGGCSGVSYGMGLDTVREDDVRMAKGQLMVIVDPFSAQYVDGVEVGYSVQEQGAGFTIENPNVSAGGSCGGGSCGGCGH